MHKGSVPFPFEGSVPFPFVSTQGWRPLTIQEATAAAVAGKGVQEMADKAKEAIRRASNEQSGIVWSLFIGGYLLRGGALKPLQFSDDAVIAHPICQ